MRGYNIDDYINRKYNHLTLIKNLNKLDKHNSKLALFRCDCGNECELPFTQVLKGKFASCGCRQGSLDEKTKKKKQKSLTQFYCNKTMKNNTSGKTGVCHIGNKYRVRIKDIHIGYFDTLEEAIEARQEAEKLHFRSDD